MIKQMLYAECTGWFVSIHPSMRLQTFFLHSLCILTRVNLQNGPFLFFPKDQHAAKIELLW